MQHRRQPDARASSPFEALGYSVHSARFFGRVATADGGPRDLLWAARVREEEEEVLVVRLGWG
eukprot:8916150-Alexandrium_andersonii.AAC.1